MVAPVFEAGETYAAPQDLGPLGAAAWWMAPGKRVFLAEDGDALGTYYLRANAEGPGGHVCNCGYITAHAARGRGVASALLAHSLRTAHEAGFRAMQFNAVVSTNTAAIGLWERAGFAVIGRVPGGFHHPTEGFVDTLIMYKALVETADAR